MLITVGLRTVAGRLLGVVAGVLDRVVLRVVRGVVVDVGLLPVRVVGLLELGRLVLPPPIVPPPAAGSCWAIALAQANRHTNAVMEIRGRRHRVDIRFSPATQTTIEVPCGKSKLLQGIIVLKVAWRKQC